MFEYKSGIYRIRVKRGTAPDKFYIGQTINFKQRMKDHFCGLRKGDAINLLLQADFNKYGYDSFNFEILLVCAPIKGILDFYEQLILDSYPTIDLYNICLDSVGSRVGVKSRPETCAKIRANTKGSHGPISPEGSEAIRRSNQTREVSLETRALMSKVRTGKRFPGRKLSESHKRAVGDHFRGKKKSAEEVTRRTATRRKNAEARGFWNPPESSKRGGEKLRGRKLSPEHRANIGRAHLGKKATPEARANMSKAQKGKPKTKKSQDNSTPEQSNG